MKFFNNRGLYLILMMCSFLGCSLNHEQEVEVTVNYHPLGAGGISQIHIQSIADNTTIREVTINRGNCATLDYGALAKGKHLKYGEAFLPVSPCRPTEIREVKVITDQDTYTFTFD